MSSPAVRIGRLVIRQLIERMPEGFQWIREGPMSVYTGPFELAKLAVSWSRTPAVGVVQDADICTFHFLNFTNDEIDNSWTAADFGQVESAFTAMWTAIKPQYGPEIALSEFLWRMDGPDHRPFGDELSPTVRIAAATGPGTAGTGRQLPPQVACSVTEVTTAHYDVSGVGVPGHAPGTGRTQRRNRWGRFYLPAPMSDAVSSGRWTSTFMNAVANGVRDFYNACVAADFLPVMYSPTEGTAWSIDEIRVDDICDVIRSRRYVTPTTRTPRTINTL